MKVTDSSLSSLYVNMSAAGAAEWRNYSSLSAGHEALCQTCRTLRYYIADYTVTRNSINES